MGQFSHHLINALGDLENYGRPAGTHYDESEFIRLAGQAIRDLYALEGLWDHMFPPAQFSCTEGREQERPH